MEVTALQCCVGFSCTIRGVSYKGQCISMLLCFSQYSNRLHLIQCDREIISSGWGGISQKTKPTLKGCFKCREIQVVSLDSLPCCAEYMGYIPTLIFFLLDWEGGDRNRVEEGNLSWAINYNKLKQILLSQLADWLVYRYPAGWWNSVFSFDACWHWFCCTGHGPGLAFFLQ